MRAALRNKERRLSALECRGLHLVCTCAIWPEERRWKAGLLGVGTCYACLSDIGCLHHRLHKCEGARKHAMWQRLAGRIARPSQLFNRQDLLPLTLFAWPPRARQWAPVQRLQLEGSLRQGPRGIYHGDGSGIEQQDKIDRRATWALVYPPRGEPGGEAAPAPEAYRRGVASVWASTVPWGEIRALINFLEVAAPGSTYGGDCKYALEVAASGVPARFRSSWSKDADLWRATRRLLDALPARAAMKFLKIKAHRSRGAAELEGADSITHWEGNALADGLAKGLARKLRTEQNEARLHAPGEPYAEALRHLAVATG